MSRSRPPARVPPSAAPRDETHRPCEAAFLLRLAEAAMHPDVSAPMRELLQQAHDRLQDACRQADDEHARWRSLFDAVPDPTSIIAFDGTVLDLNKAGMAAYGRPREQIVGQPIHVLNPDLPRDHMGPVLDTLRRGETYVIEVTNMREDGSRFPVEVHSAPFRYRGRDDVVLAVARDLSDRQVAEAQFHELFQAIDKGVTVQDQDGQLLMANPAAMRILGVPDGVDFRDHLLSDDWTVLDAEGQRIPRSQLPNMRTQRSGKTIESELIGLYHRRQGRLRWLLFTAVPVFTPGARQPHQVMSLLSDVTELKRDSRLFARTQALAHIGGWEWDAGRDRLFLTEEAKRILGRQEPPRAIDQLLGVLSPVDRKRLRGALDECLQHGAHIELELQGRRDNGAPFWVRLIGEPSADESAARSLSGTLQDISARKFAEEGLRLQARTDPLTGLLNRQALLADLALRLAPPDPIPTAVLYIDLDRFKLVNDALGHAAGDRLLTQAAGRIAIAVGREGVIGRLGGDEFLVICGTDGDAQRPERLANAIVDAFHGTFDVDKDRFSVSTSIGIARSPEDGITPQELLHNADAAMYDSKRRLHGAWQAFNPALAQSQQERLHLETQLRQALDRGEFSVVYQPQVELKHRRIVAAEALIRWQNEHLGPMRPDHFISHAESTGDIVRIGDWVLRTACQQVAAWRDAGLGLIRVAVNVSYRQFLGEDLAQRVRDILDQYGLPGAALELEFTERVLIEDAPSTLKTFADLRAIGVMLSIDDFGEGYSALNYLRRLPIHGLKLSQHFLQGVPHNRSDVAVCQAVAGIARSLGLGLVAEGVETEAQLRFLLHLGVPVGQGFLFAPGLPPEEFARLLDDSQESGDG